MTIWTIPRCDSRSSLFYIPIRDIEIHTRHSQMQALTVTVLTNHCCIFSADQAQTTLKMVNICWTARFRANVSLQVDALQFANAEKRKEEEINNCLTQMIPYILLVVSNSPGFFFFLSLEIGRILDGLTTMEVKIQCADREQFPSLRLLSRSWGGGVWGEVHARYK